MKKLIYASALTLILSSSFSFAEETAVEKVQTAGDHAATSVKKGYRATQDKLCAKGDVECAAQKGKHKLQNAGDAVSDKANEVKRKAD